MNFATIKKIKESFLKDNKIFNDSENEIISTCFETISHDIHQLIDGENVEQNTNKFNQILDCLLCISSKTLNAPISDKSSEFSSAFSELVFNWNENIQKDEVIKQICLFISRISEMRDIIISSIKVLKDVDNRMRDLSTWSPPAYEISKEYFEKLLENNERK
jgi:hypothetical protein